MSGELLLSILAAEVICEIIRNLRPDTNQDMQILLHCFQRELTLPAKQIVGERFFMNFDPFCKLLTRVKVGYDFIGQEYLYRELKTPSELTVKFWIYLFNDRQMNVNWVQCKRLIRLMYNNKMQSCLNIWIKNCVLQNRVSLIKKYFLLFLERENWKLAHQILNLRNKDDSPFLILYPEDFCRLFFIDSHYSVIKRVIKKHLPVDRQSEIATHMLDGAIWQDQEGEIFKTLRIVLVHLLQNDIKVERPIIHWNKVQNRITDRKALRLHKILMMRNVSVEQKNIVFNFL